MTSPRNWRADLENVLKGLEHELQQPALTVGVLDDLKAVLDHVRNVVLAALTSIDEADHAAQLRDIRIRRTVGVCRNLRTAVAAGSIARGTPRILELADALAQLEAELGRRHDSL